MNNILVINNNINNYNDDNIKIENNTIYFKKSGKYNIKYDNTNTIDITYKLKDNINITIDEYQNNTSSLTSNIKYLLAENSILNINKFTINDTTKETITIDLEGLNAEINYHFSNISINQEKHHIIINHHAPKTVSNIINRTISTNDATIDYTIDSILPKNNYGCILNQETKIITNDSSNCYIRPNMFIDEEDVDARHASYIGKFKEEELFYLMTRGLSLKESIKLLVKGYILSNIKVEEDLEKIIINDINKYWR